ncbi:MAG TPA: hypothetical protein VGT78_03000 [Rhizomicrobium sp.]|nr:hypothetical protein [Rhizomicrobium sp.]
MSARLSSTHPHGCFVNAPNLGGFAGISFRYDNAKISFGYRGDFFFAAMDHGIDTRKSTTLGFNGPFASIRVGRANCASIFPA